MRERVNKGRLKLDILSHLWFWRAISIFPKMFPNLIDLLQGWYWVFLVTHFQRIVLSSELLLKGNGVGYFVTCISSCSCSVRNPVQSQAFFYASHGSAFLSHSRGHKSLKSCTISNLTHFISNLTHFFLNKKKSDKLFKKGPNFCSQIA